MGQVTIKPAEQVEQERLESLANQARAKRDTLLRDSDYMAMPDYPSAPQNLSAYRQALRDIPEQSGFPELVDWPTL